MATLTTSDYVNHWLKDAQEMQGEYDDCKTISQAIVRYTQILETERAIGLRIDPTDTDYFLEFIQQAKHLSKLWKESSQDNNKFLELVRSQSLGFCEELAEILVSGNFNELCF
jgi:hypothetical protein